MDVEVLPVWDLPARHPQNPKAFPSCGRRQPGADALGLLDPIKMLQQAKPGRLEDISGIGGVKSMPPCDSPNGGSEPFDQGIPGILVPGPGGLYEQGNG
jgi:hypothetical protein